MLALHADIKALQRLLGISYKDASHRLYMAEIEKLKLHDISVKSHRALKLRVKTKLESFEERLDNIMQRSQGSNANKTLSSAASLT